MVLPEGIATPLRQAIANGQLGGSGGGAAMSVNISAMGPRDVKRALGRGGTLQKSIRDLHKRMKR